MTLFTAAEPHGVKHAIRQLSSKKTAVNITITNKDGKKETAVDIGHFRLPIMPNKNTEKD